MYRVRYTENNGVFTSKDMMSTSGETFKVSMSKDTSRNVIVTEIMGSRGTYLMNTEQTNFSMAKKFVKSALENYGVVFSKESRTKSNDDGLTNL